MSRISFLDRERFVEDNLNEIFNSADMPLDGRRWWMNAEDPWQCLAVCFELSAALRSPKPSEYISKLAIHQDGTCNGLQHYAALGGDLAGAKLVNLVPGEKPGDVYTGVSTRVAEMVKTDAANGKAIAIKLDGFITRKIVKQTVMTNTYGVTRIGAQIQILNRLKDIKDLNMTDSELDVAARYLTDKVFLTMENLFEGARKLQIWLNETAKTISRSIPTSEVPSQMLIESKWLKKNGHFPNSIDTPNTTEESIDTQETESELSIAALSESDEDETPTEAQKKTKADVTRMASVVWTSPLGLPIVQPYWNHKSKMIQTSLQLVTFYDYSVPCAVDTRKQAMAFPPNFVHSLDACHMQLSAIACKSANIEFAAVHDSYWSHACDIDKLSSVLREAFIRLHSEDLMIRLRNELIERYKDHQIPATIHLEGEELDNFRAYSKSIQETTGARRAPTKKFIQTFVDLVIEPLPEKGGLDIEVIKKSLYFFH